MSTCIKCGCEVNGEFDYCPYCGVEMFSPREKELFEALRKLRMRLAKVADVAPFVIFHDTTLRAIVKRRPMSMAELLEIPGIGSAKAERYGAFILEEIRSFGF